MTVMDWPRLYTCWGFVWRALGEHIPRPEFTAHTGRAPACGPRTSPRCNGYKPETQPKLFLNAFVWAAELRWLWAALYAPLLALDIAARSRRRGHIVVNLRPRHLTRLVVPNRGPLLNVPMAVVFPSCSDMTERSILVRLNCGCRAPKVRAANSVRPMVDRRRTEDAV